MPTKFFTHLFPSGNIDFEAQQELFSHVSARLSLSVLHNQDLLLSS